MMTSVTLPAAIDTITRIGFEGYCCACAVAAPSARIRGKAQTQH
jgi:hypothetical protein